MKNTEGYRVRLIGDPSEVEAIMKALAESMAPAIAAFQGLNIANIIGNNATAFEALAESFKAVSEKMNSTLKTAFGPLANSSIYYRPFQSPEIPTNLDQYIIDRSFPSITENLN